MLQRNLQQHNLHYDHVTRLYKQRGVEACAEPVEDFEKGRDEHDKWDVEGEAGGGFGAVDAVDLVGIGSYGRDDETGRRLVRKSYVDLIRHTTTYKIGAT